MHRGASKKFSGCKPVYRTAGVARDSKAVDHRSAKEIRPTRPGCVDGIIPAEGLYTIMNSLSLNPKWSVLKKRLRERYQHLTEADLAEIESSGDDWLLRMQQRIGGSPFEIAQLVDEITEAPHVCLQLMAFSERERICA
jgi:hypothetical protein